MRISHLNRQRNTVGDSGRPIDIEFTGPLILSGDPTEGVDAATKQYVDNRFLSLSASDLKSGILPIGRLPAFSGDLTNVAGSNVFTLNPTGVTSGTYRKVTVDAKGRVIGSSALGASDIPPLDWTKITKNKPTTLAGYGITDGINLTGDTIVGTLKSNATPTAAMHAVTRGYIETAASGAGGLVSPGVIIGFPTTTTPSGYLRCNGGEVRKDIYPELYSVIGDKFNSIIVPGAGKPWEQHYAINDIHDRDINGWTAATALPYAVLYHKAVVTKNRVYLIGGGNSSSRFSAVYTAPISADGTLGAWTAATSLPGEFAYFTAFVAKNKLYVLAGGTNAISSTTTVYFANINADGTLGAWTVGTPLPQPNSYAEAIVIRNKVYLIGGHTESALSETVYVANINSDGTLGAWTLHSTLPGSLYGFVLAVVKNKVYAIGGGAYQTFSDIVYVADISADGTLGAWVAAGNIPVPLAVGCVYVSKHYIYLIGGAYGTNLYTRNTYKAKINADGTLGAWSYMGTLPYVLGYSTLIAVNNKLHILGGYINNAVNATIMTASIDGGSNDYSSYYDGTITVTDSNKFKLPDYTSKETLTERLYIKY